MGDDGICARKSASSDGFLKKVEVFGPTCSESSRYQGVEDQHQCSEEGSREMVCRRREMGGSLFKRRKESA